MKKTINITFLELKKLLEKREFLIGLIMVLVLGGGMAYGAYTFPRFLNTTITPFIYLIVLFWVMPRLC